MLEHLPPPLHNRHTTQDILIGLFIAPPTDSQTVQIADAVPALAAQVAQLCAALRAWLPLPPRIALIHPPGSVAQAAWPIERHAPDCTHYCAQGQDYEALLARLEAAWLPAALAHPYHRALAQLYVPAVLTLDAPPPYPAAGLALVQPSTQDLAATLVLLASDPPTRRRTLDAQRPLRRPRTAHDAALWRVEGLFDSSYSLAIVNRQLALALQEHGGPLPEVAPTFAAPIELAPQAPAAQTAPALQADQAVQVRLQSQLRHALEATNCAQHEARQAQAQQQQAQEQQRQAQTQAQQAHAHARQVQEQLQQAQARIHALQASLSWRITAPLRWGLEAVRHPVVFARRAANHALFQSVETLERPLSRLMAGVLQHPQLSQRLGHWLLTRYPHLHGHLVDVAYRSGVLRRPTPPHSSAAYDSALAHHSAQARRIYAALQATQAQE